MKPPLRPRQAAMLHLATSSTIGQPAAIPNAASHDRKCTELHGNALLKAGSVETKPRPAAGADPSNPSSDRLLAPRQITAVRLLLGGSDVSAVARLLKIAPSTIFRWRRDPRFIQEMDRQLGLIVPSPRDGQRVQ